jgi:hypothetical protein
MMSRERKPAEGGDRRNRRDKRVERKKGASRAPIKRTARKLPERRTMIAAARRRVWSSIGRGSWRLDRLGNRGLERAHPPLRRAGRAAAPAARGVRAVAAPLLAFLALLGRRALWLLFAALAAGERLLRAALRLAVRGATALSAVVTPRRALAATIVAAAGALAVSQFIDYRGVEIGGAAYAGLPAAAQPPAVAVRTAGEAHSYLLVPLAALAGLLGAWAGTARARPRLGLVIAALGLVALAVILLVDLPAGLDVGGQSARFAGASAVLDDGFYAELAAAAGLASAGVLYYARPCRIPISSSGRAASARRRRPRRPDSSPARVARSA